jgi:hypothetical protein
MPSFCRLICEGLPAAAIPGMLRSGAGSAVNPLPLQPARRRGRAAARPIYLGCWFPANSL